MQRNEESDEFASSVRASAAQINEGPRPPVRARCQQAPRAQNQHALGSAARSGARGGSGLKLTRCSQYNMLVKKHIALFCAARALRVRVLSVQCRVRAGAGARRRA